MSKVTTIPATMIQRIYGRIWRFFYVRRRNEERAASREAYAEMMAERDRKGLVIPTSND